MKRLSFFLILIFTMSVSSKLLSQTINGKPLSEVDVTYIEVTSIYPSTIYTNISYYIDYGQKFKRISETLLRNEKGEVMKFNSSMHAINYICQFGYEVISIVKDESSGGDKYLLKKLKKQ